MFKTNFSWHNKIRG